MPMETSYDQTFILIKYSTHKGQERDFQIFKLFFNVLIIIKQKIKDSGFINLGVTAAEKHWTN